MIILNFENSTFLGALESRGYLKSEFGCCFIIAWGGQTETNDCKIAIDNNK